MRASLVAVGIVLMILAVWIGLLPAPDEAHSGLAILCCLLAAMLFIGCFPGGRGGRTA